MDRSNDEEIVAQHEARVGVLKGHVQKLVSFLEHAQAKGCFTLEQASQVYSILLAIRKT